MEEQSKRLVGNESQIKPRCIDLFAGAGGFAVGFELAGWSILGANDADSEAAATFRENFPASEFFECPIGDLTSSELLDACSLERGELECLIGGPPCQSFSYNNHHRSAVGERAGLFRDYLRIVEGLHPQTLVMENVPGIRTIGGGSVVEEMCERLANLGYRTSHRILYAEQFGTPQLRRRFFLVGSRVGNAADLLPEPTHWRNGFYQGKKLILRPVTARKRFVTISSAIGDLPPVKNGGGSAVATYCGQHAKTEFQRIARNTARKLYNHVCHELGELNLSRIVHVPPGGNWRDIPRSLLPPGMKRAKLSDHTKRYGRLEWNGYASTILTKCDPHWGAYVHPEQHRTITVREAARLQGFPDTFRFAGDNVGAQYVQVGNAVPVQVAHEIAKRVLTHLSSECDSEDIQNVALDRVA